MAEWVQIFLALTPLMAWFFLGIGVPWALAILPRHDWADRAMVLTVGLALGPLLGTLWLFAVGTVARFSVIGTLGGTVIIAAMGAWIAWGRRKQLTLPIETDPLEIAPHWQLKDLDRALWVMMAIALAAATWDTAFWPFLRYDTLWTFGYNARIFILEGHIPARIDYYPQLVPLTYTYGQLLWGEVNDHAARAAVPWFILSSTMAAYLVGWRVYGQRLIGTITAALWLLSPAVLVWSSSGDLEIVMAVYFSLAATFVTLAWREDDGQSSENAGRYMILAGLMLGAAMWTKPTAGAFIFGMVLVLAGAFVYVAVDDVWQWRLRKLWLMTRVGLVAAPIGGIWYARNIWVGHDWTNLPASYWQELAQRSGMQLDVVWMLAVLAALAASISAIRARQWWRVGMLWAAMILISAAILPTLLSIPADGWRWQTSWDMINGFREPYRRLDVYEGVLMAGGLGLLLLAGWPAWLNIPAASRKGFTLTWGLGLPFFAVFFWSFSYHYRLMLTILPLMLAPLAALLLALIYPLMVSRARRTALVVVAVLLAIPAPIAGSFHTWRNTLETNELHTDFDKYHYANPALMETVVRLQNYAADQERDSLRVLAPGENRLAFFFPTWEIDDETLPTSINDLADYDVFVYGVVDVLWNEYGLYPNQVQAWTKLAWIYPLPPAGDQWVLDGPDNLPMPRFLKPISAPLDDGTFHYELFAINVNAPHVYIQPTFVESDRMFSINMQLLGYDVPTEMVAGESYTLKFYWRGGIVPPPGDYSIFVHLTPPDDPTMILAQSDGGLMGGAYPTRLLTRDTVFQDRRGLTIPMDIATQDVVLRIGVYDLETGTRFTVRLDNGEMVDSLRLQPTIHLKH